MKRIWLVIEIDGDEREDLPPSFDVFPSCLEIYGDWRVVAEWSDVSKPRPGWLLADADPPKEEAENE